jgi:uncharacterized protein YqhQ
MNTTILLKLILSHILTDFFLQPNAWIKDKQQHKAKSKYLYLHGAIAGILTFVFTSEWTISAFILITHILIDLWKLYQNDGLKYFLIDQFLHFIVLIISWLWLID